MSRHAGRGAPVEGPRVLNGRLGEGRYIIKTSPSLLVHWIKDRTDCSLCQVLLPQRTVFVRNEYPADELDCFANLIILPDIPVGFVEQFLVGVQLVFQQRAAKFLLHEPLAQGGELGVAKMFA